MCWGLCLSGQINNDSHVHSKSFDWASIPSLPRFGRGRPAGRRVELKPQVEGPGELLVHAQLRANVDLGAPEDGNK